MIIEVRQPKSLFDSIGLCGSCKYVRLIVSDRGSKFYLCRRSEADATFPKYPRLPLVVCPGYEKTETTAP